MPSASQNVSDFDSNAHFTQFNAASQPYGAAGRPRRTNRRFHYTLTFD
jgi:hypothetical protein